MSEPFNISDFLRFRRMITPVIIEVIFWVGMVIALLSALGMIIAGFSGGHGGGGGQVLMGLLMLVLGPLYVRIVCELIIIFFRINETLTDIKNRVGPSDQG